MSQRLASKPHIYGKRKRKKNGVSVSRSVLERVSATPINLPVMPVWNTNVEDPTSVRRSTVPVLPELLLQDIPVAETEGEEFVTVPVVDSIPRRPKRKQGNNSVSCNATRATGFPPVNFIADFLQ